MNAETSFKQNRKRLKVDIASIHDSNIDLGKFFVTSLILITKKIKIKIADIVPWKCLLMSFTRK